MATPRCSTGTGSAATGLHANEIGPLLAGEYGLHVIAPDPPGHGRSPARDADCVPAVTARRSAPRICFRSSASSEPHSSASRGAAASACWFAAQLPGTHDRARAGRGRPPRLSAAHRRSRRRSPRRAPSGRTTPSTAGTPTSPPSASRCAAGRPELEEAHRAIMVEEAGRVAPVLSAEALGAINQGSRLEPVAEAYPAIAGGRRARAARRRGRARAASRSSASGRRSRRRGSRRSLTGSTTWSRSLPTGSPASSASLSRLSRRRRSRSAGRARRRPRRRAARPRSRSQHLGGAGRGRQQPVSTSSSVSSCTSSGLERAREAAAAEVPAVELLQEAGRAPLAELADGLAHEQDQLGDDLLARRLVRVAVEDLAQRPRVALRRAADHHCGRAGRGQDRLRPRARGDVARRDHRHVDELDELGGQRVVGLAGVHLLAPSAGAASATRRRPRPGAARARGTRASRSRSRGASSP